MEHTVHAVGVVYAQDDRGLYESSHPVRDVDVRSLLRRQDRIIGGAAERGSPGHRSFLERQK